MLATESHARKKEPRIVPTRVPERKSPLPVPPLLRVARGGGALQFSAAPRLRGKGPTSIRASLRSSSLRPASRGRFLACAFAVRKRLRGAAWARSRRVLNVFFALRGERRDLRGAVRVHPPAPSPWPP